MAKSSASWISCRRVDGVTVHLFLRNCTARAGQHLTSTGRWASGSVVMRFMACRNHKWARVPLTSLWLPAMTTCLSVVFCYYKVTTRGSERNAFYHRHVLELSFPLRYGSQRDSGNAQESPKREIPKIVLVSRPGREWLVSSHNPYIAGHCPQGDSQGLIGCCPGKIPTPFHAIPHFKEKCNVGCVVALG